MDSLHCSVHSANDAIAYCVDDKTLFCTQCYNIHRKHETTAIDDYNKAQKIQYKSLLIRETSTLMAKHKISSSNIFNAAEAFLDKQKSAFMESSDILGDCSSKNSKNKEMSIQCIREFENILSIVTKFTETNVNAIVLLAW